MSIPAWAVRGAKVVCINLNGWGVLPEMPNAPAREPMPHEVLTIRDVITTDEFSRRAPRFVFAKFEVLLSFEELEHDWLYASHNFRPLVSTKTEAEDLAHFRQYLKADEPA